MAQLTTGRILVVADNPAPTTHAVLDEAGFDVVRAKLGRELQLLQQSKFDLVVTHFVLPEKSGLSLLERIHQHGIEVPVLVVQLKTGAPSVKMKRQGAFICRTSGLLDAAKRLVRERRAGERRVAPRSFRNRLGEEVEMASVPATTAKNEFGRVLDTAIEKGAVAITRHDAAKAVLLSVDAYDALVGARREALDTLTGEFDALMAKMQTPAAKKGARAAFGASPAELGKAALAAARKRG